MYNLFVIEHDSTKHTCTQFVLHTWEMWLLPLATLDWLARWRRIRRIRKRLSSNTFTLLVVLYHGGETVSSSLMFMLHHREALYTAGQCGCLQCLSMMQQEHKNLDDVFVHINARTRRVVNTLWSVDYDVILSRKKFLKCVDDLWKFHTTMLNEKGVIQILKCQMIKISLYMIKNNKFLKLLWIQTQHCMAYSQGLFCDGKRRFKITLK
jgi:hypothetical protein